jgi:glycosyltransferase involved in cell wall biosynthesis
MRILFVTDLHYLPQGSGGCQSLIHELAMELLERGHQPAVLAALDYKGALGYRNRILMKLLDRKTIRDDKLGYPVYRRWTVSGALDDSISVIRPDIAIAMPRDSIAIAKELLRLAVPAIVYFQDVDFPQLSGDPSQLVNVQFLTNSQFTARRYKEKYGIDSVVIPPLIRADRYRTVNNQSNVTMINPHPKKGGNIAVEIARRCPEIPFCLVECWALQDDHRRSLHDQIRGLHNVTLRPRTDDMKTVYSHAKILLAPSVCEEAWGRVVSEAHISGIPVVASNRGGLPEAVGPGGIVLDPDDSVELWVEAVRRLWNDVDYYREKSEAALAHSNRSALDTAGQIETLLAVIQSTLKSQRDSHNYEFRQRTAAAPESSAISP